MAMARGEMRGCADERQRQKKGNRKNISVGWELEDREMLYITNCRMFKIGLLCEQRKTAAFKNHLHFHVVLIKANVLHLFGDWKSSVNTKRVSFPRVYFNMEGTAYV